MTNSNYQFKLEADFFNMLVFYLLSKFLGLFFVFCLFLQ